MVFKSRKFVKTLALSALCSSFVCHSQVFCVKKWALGDTEHFDDKESLYITYPLRRFALNGICGFFDPNTNFLYIGGTGKIDENSFKDNGLFSILQVRSIRIGKDVIIGEGTFKNWKSLKRVIIGTRRINTHLLTKHPRKHVSKYLIPTIDDLIPLNRDEKALRSTINGIIKIPTVQVGAHAFENCSALEEVTILSQCNEIYDFAFSGCTSLREVKFPNTLFTIGNHAFVNCESLREVKFPDTLFKIGDFAFAHCKSLQEVKFPDEMLEIGSSAFTYCTSLQEVQLPNQLPEIRLATFAYCTSLKKVLLPDSLCKIGSIAFYSCGSLGEITIPKKVVSIRIKAFRDCMKLKAKVPTETDFRAYNLNSNTFDSDAEITKY